MIGRNPGDSTGKGMEKQIPPSSREKRVSKMEMEGICQGGKKSDSHPFQTVPPANGHPQKPSAKNRKHGVPFPSDRKTNSPPPIPFSEIAETTAAKK